MMEGFKVWAKARNGKKCFLFIHYLGKATPAGKIVAIQFPLILTGVKDELPRISPPAGVALPLPVDCKTSPFSPGSKTHSGRKGKLFIYMKVSVKSKGNTDFGVRMMIKFGCG